MSRLNYCNSLLTFTSKRNIHRLQMVQNQLARVVSGSGYWQSAAPILLSLHWLPVQQRIEYKIVNMVFKSRMNFLPEYLSRGLTVRLNSSQFSFFSRVIDHWNSLPNLTVYTVYTSIRPVRSSMQNTYVVPRVRLEVANNRLFMLVQNSGIICQLNLGQQFHIQNSRNLWKHIILVCILINCFPVIQASDSLSDLWPVNKCFTYLLIYYFRQFWYIYYIIIFYGIGLP